MFSQKLKKQTINELAILYMGYSVLVCVMAQPYRASRIAYINSYITLTDDLLFVYKVVNSFCIKKRIIAI